MSGYCGAAAGNPATNAEFSLRRSQETVDAMGLLGLNRTASLLTTDIIFLGYPQNGLEDIAQTNGTSWQGDSTGLHRTYGPDFDASNATCNGDFRYLLSGVHSNLTAEAMAADMESLLAVTNPSDIYAHAGFDGHPDHAKLTSSLTAAMIRRGTNAWLHTTLIHPEGTGGCQIQSAALWPNPTLASVNGNPFARFTPGLPFTAPTVPGCDPDATPTGSSWGPDGPPNEIVPVPAAMQAATEAANLKWQVISRYATQIDCNPQPEYHVNCGYMRAFVKREEFFWKRLYSPLKDWPRPFTAQWTSEASISQQGQIFEGQWVHEGNGIRPAATGFDRVITLGDMDWTDYEVTAKMTFNSFDTSHSGGRRGGGPRPRLAGALGLGPAAVRASVRRALPLLVQRQRPAALPAPARVQPRPGARHDRRLAERRPPARRPVHDALPRARPRQRQRRATAARCGRAASPSRAPGRSRRTSRTGRARPARTAARSSSSRTTPTRRSATSPSRRSPRSPSAARRRVDRQASGR